MPELEAVLTVALGAHPEAGHWLNFELDAISQSPAILFPYPRAIAPGFYIPTLVKMEFGSLTDQRPTGTHMITSVVFEISGD